MSKLQKIKDELDEDFIRNCDGEGLDSVVGWSETCMDCPSDKLGELISDLSDDELEDVDQMISELVENWIKTNDMDGVDE